MTRLPRDPLGTAIARGQQRMAPGGRLWSESPVRRTYYVPSATTTEDVVIEPPGPTPLFWPTLKWFSADTFHTGNSGDPPHSLDLPDYDDKGIFDGMREAPGGITPELSRANTLSDQMVVVLPPLPPITVADYRTGSYSQDDATSSAFWGSLEGLMTDFGSGANAGVWKVYNNDARPDGIFADNVEGTLLFTGVAGYKAYDGPTFTMQTLPYTAPQPTRFIRWPHLHGDDPGSMTVNVANYLKDSSLSSGNIITPHPPPGVEIGTYYWRDVDTAVTVTPGIATFTMVGTPGYDNAGAKFGYYYKWTSVTGYKYVRISAGIKAVSHWWTFPNGNFPFPNSAPYQLTDAQAGQSLAAQLWPASDTLFGNDTVETVFYLWWQDHWQEYTA